MLHEAGFIGLERETSAQKIGQGESMPLRLLSLPRRGRGVALELMRTSILVTAAGLAAAICLVSPRSSASSEESCGKQGAAAVLTYREAREIAQASECVAKGSLKETGYCNRITGTWWIDLEVPGSKCRPACVVEVETRRASINWRCFGML